MKHVSWNTLYLNIYLKFSSMFLSLLELHWKVFLACTDEHILDLWYNLSWSQLLIDGLGLIHSGGSTVYWIKFEPFYKVLNCCFSAIFKIYFLLLFNLYIFKFCCQCLKVVYCDIEREKAKLVQELAQASSTVVQADSGLYSCLQNR